MSSEVSFSSPLARQGHKLIHIQKPKPWDTSYNLSTFNDTKDSNEHDSMFGVQCVLGVWRRGYLFSMI